MISRGTIIAALVVMELAILGGVVVALRGSHAAPPFIHHGEAATAAGTGLIAGGPHQIFASGAHPTLIVDIGYADLTILATHAAAEIDVSLSPSSVGGVFASKAPIAAHGVGSTVRIAKLGGGQWNVGDDRMVTVLVPPDTQVTVVAAGDIRAHGLRAEASFKSVGNGTITVEDYAAPALRATASDGISLHEIVTAHLDASATPPPSLRMRAPRCKVCASVPATAA